MTPTETITILRRYNEWRRGCDIEHPPTVGKAIDTAIELLDRLEAAEKERDALRAALRHEADCVEAAKAEIAALRVKVERMEKQGPVGQFIQHPSNGLWEQDGYGDNPDAKPLFALPGAQPAHSVKDAILDDLQSQFDSEGIAEHGSGDALIRLSDAIAAVEDNFAQPAPGAPWVSLAERMPNPDKHDRVLIYTEGYDFGGEQVFDVKAEDLNECRYIDPDEQPETCKAASHWMPHPRNAIFDYAAHCAHPAPSVPEGWKLVPVEPTKEMINHVIDERLEAIVTGKEHTFIDIYKAMLAAAPKREE